MKKSIEFEFSNFRNMKLTRYTRLTPDQERKRDSHL